jgi:hypothetical protein
MGLFAIESPTLPDLTSTEEMAGKSVNKPPTRFRKSATT